MLIKSQQNWLKQWIGQYAVTSVNFLILFEIRRNCLRSGRSWTLYLSIRRVIKQIVVIVGTYPFCQLHTTFYPAYSVKVNAICRGNYWGSSVWILTQQINYWSYILHSSNTWKKMGIQRGSAIVVCRFQESLWFS